MKPGSILERPDRRHQRAMTLMAELARIVEPYLAHAASQRLLYRELMELLTREGVEVLTDYTRWEIGLPTRDGKGWTIEEIIALEKARLDAMTRPRLAQP